MNPSKTSSIQPFTQPSKSDFYGIRRHRGGKSRNDRRALNTLETMAHAVKGAVATPEDLQAALTASILDRLAGGWN